MKRKLTASQMIERERQRIERKRERFIRRATVTAAHILEDDDYKRGAQSAGKYCYWQDEQLIAIVRKLEADGVRHINIPRMAVARYCS